MVRTLAVVLALGAFVPSAWGEVLKYDNQDELRGAAMVAPGTVRRLLTKLMAFCAEQNPSMLDETAAALKAWESRHAAYAAMSARIRGEFYSLATDPSRPPEVRAQFKRAQEVLAEMEQAIDAQAEALLAPLRVGQKHGVGEPMCKAYVQAVNEGNMDLKVTSPDLAKFFEEQAAQK
jgi:hypothetical protein